MQSRTLRLGTRKSLLAWAQSSWVAREIERCNPNLKVELLGIETRGDKIQDVPLQKVEGKDFFVAELDEALNAGRADLSVHSMKDLSLTRPGNFKLAAVPPRELPHDIIFFSNRAALRLEKGEPIRIGTSSPRRLENLPAFLARALPRARKETGPRIEWVEIRGNVNTRLGRLHEPTNSERALEGVVLAFAGIQRLFNDSAGRNALQSLLLHTRWMLLPLKECPTAPAQGALAIECRADDLATVQALAKLHDPASAAAAALERSLLEKWGGGCHQRFGATAIPHATLGELLYIKGKLPDQSYIDETQWAAPPNTKPKAPWNGRSWRAQMLEVDLQPDLPDLRGKFVFVAHHRALHAGIGSGRVSQSRVWTSGTASWFKLAERGVWVEGCAENLGFDWLLPTLRREVWGHGGPNDWHVLTHQGATHEWSPLLTAEHIHATYRLADSGESKDAVAALEQADEAYFSSASQFERLRKYLPAQAGVSCGPGRTAQAIREAGVAVKIFPSEAEWREWCKQ